MNQQLLRYLLLLDAAVLLVLGVLLVVVPTRVETAFQFTGLPPGVSYIVSMWGCVLMTLSLGYAVAARDPLRHIAWIQVAIARGALECLVGIVYLARGIVTYQQVGFGIAVAAFITLAYIGLYPRALAPVR